MYHSPLHLREVHILIVCCYLLTAVYALLMLLYRYGWRKQHSFSVPEDFQPSTTISVIIPARNEAQNIGDCLRSVLAQHYPKELLEIIVADDCSEDETAAIAKNLSPEIRVISMAEIFYQNAGIKAPKKMAISTAIQKSHGELIVTTDADCISHPDWLRTIAALYEKSTAAMIIGPVVYKTKWKLVELFQSIDFTMMQGITVASHQLKMGNMANGANLAFSRAAFDKVQGYQGIDHLASGDDYLLLHKIQSEFPDRIQYLKSEDVIVETSPQPDWKSFIQQRIRWASKSGKYPDHKLTAVLMLVYLFNLALLAVFVLAIFNKSLWLLLVGMLAMKIAAELIFLIPVSGFFRKRNELWLFPFLQPLHVLYIVSVGFLGMKGSYEWKGRKLR